MLQRSLFYAFLFFSLSSSAQQFKYDNVAFKTVSPDELCAALEKNKGYLLLDVRSSGENNDTSQFTGLNIGHLKGALNINVRELGTRLSEINAYKNQPVFVYCSHSQRSRRASKMLVDSGFTNVYNINGGLTSIYYTNAVEKGCLQSLVQTNNKYEVISAIELCGKLSSKKSNVLVLDVRYDSAFKHISKDAQDNAYGIIKNSMHISFADLPDKWQTIPMDKDIVLTDLDATDASKAATLLTQKGFKKVSVLIEGIDRWVNTDINDLSCKNDWYVSSSSYRIIPTKEFGREANKDHLLLDIREAAVFNNTHKDEFRNIGRLKNAVNIPLAEISNRVAELDKYKNKDIIIYGFGGGRDSYEAADILKKNGFTKINILASGIFDVRWTAANIKGQEYLKEFVVDVPEVNR
ncbi:MAG: rhodanese-like domain-containing protein [Ferruginibacter sp.]